VVVAHPCRAEDAADLFIRYSHQDDVARERNLLTLERDECVQVRDARPFHVECAASPDLAFDDFRSERIARPARTIRRHDVHVMQEHQGLRRPASFQPRENHGPPRTGLVTRDRNALSLEDALQQIGRLRDVARRH
jgi:hypothetical protein